jgi:hypothetical protein
MIELYSPFGIPNNFFLGNCELKIFLAIDPNVIFFNKEKLKEIRLKFDKVILIHGCEPPLINNISEKILENISFFDKVLTFDENLINQSIKCEKFCFGSSWIMTDKSNTHINLFDEYYNHFSLEKKFKLSFVKSNKNNLPGHKLRHQISYLLKDKPYEILFPNYVKNTEKKLLFEDSMFHLTIENSQVVNYFTEKIIDCFMSYTIPIYWGCPNIGDYFNMEGVIVFNNENELKTILENLTPEMYIEKKKAIVENYEIAKNNYAFFFDRINNELKKYC